MSAFDIYIFTLCLIVLALLTTLSVVMIAVILKLSCKSIRFGGEDERILAEANKIPTRMEKIEKLVSRIISLLLATIFFIAFMLSSLVACASVSTENGLPALRVVNSDSMSKKHEKNYWLFDNNLDDQFDTFDLIITQDIPPEDELELYDIVVYKLKDDTYIVHRIIQILPPNVNHPNETYYLLQGDAEERADALFVTYDQMVAIYRGQRIPFVGSFVKFMQSPAGMICIALVLIAMIAGPIADKKLKKERELRLAILLAQKQKTATVSPSQSVAPTSVTKVIEVVQQQEAETMPIAVNESTSNEQTQELAPTKVAEEIKTVIADEPNEKLAVEDKTAEEISTDKVVEQKVKPIFVRKRDNRNFKQRLTESPDVTKERYNDIVKFLGRIKGVRIISGKKFETYKYRSIPIVRFAIRGKTLNVYIALNCEGYFDSKYIFTDLSGIKAHVNYPMQVKVTSTRKTRWTIELLHQLCVKENVPLLETSNED